MMILRIFKPEIGQLKNVYFSSRTKPCSLFLARWSL